MANTAITLACPAWCTAHISDRDGESHAALNARITAGTVGMTQVVESPSAVFTAQDQPTIWLNDEPMSLAAAAEVAALLAALVASALVTVTR